MFVALRNHEAQIALAVGLSCVLAASVLRLVPGGAVWSSLMLVAGVGVVILAIWRSGHGVHYTRYRQRSWTWRDSLVAAGSLLAASSFLLWSDAREYTPYPLLTWPAFDIRVGIALLGLLVPALLVQPQANGAADHLV